VRVAADHLLHQAAGHVVDAPAFVLREVFGEPGVQHHLQQHVAQFLAQRRQVRGHDGVVRLVALLEQVRREAFVGLLPLPRVAAR
jgi:hypothetical protein